MRTWVDIATKSLGGPVTLAENVDDYFDMGVGKLVRSCGTVVVFEPLVAKMLICAALEIDQDGARGLNPLLAPMLQMSFTQNESARSFLAKVFLAPVIHNFIALALERAVGGAHRFVAVPHAKLVDGARHGLGIFMPETKAGPDAVHRFDGNSAAERCGALGQIKFRADMNEADWVHALRTVDPLQLYAEKESATPRSRAARIAKQTRQANLKEKRNAANVVLSEQCPGGLCSYIFTICEPPVQVPHVQTLADGRKLFVFSPQLCPTLFDAFHDIDVWTHLKAIKNMQAD
jgi:hypothetical protein